MRGVVEPKAAARALEEWYATHARDLPWRRTLEPYRVLLVEFIMQQTRIEVGTRYYERFVARYPTIDDLARAPEEDVLAMWSGLGYYARAKRLHATARRIVADFAGQVPEDPDQLEDLPGIGPYTAGAIASIAYDRRATAVDGNQERVIGRLLGMRTTEGRRAKARIERAADALLGHGSPRNLNQALMDLGSMVCLPGAPRCGSCPLAAGCRSDHRVGTRRRAKTSTRPLEDWEAIVHVRGGRVWIAAPTGHGLLGATWTPPLKPAPPSEEEPDFVLTFSHKSWRVRCVRGQAAPTGAGRWVTLEDLRGIPHGRLTARIVRQALAPTPRGASTAPRRRASSRARP